MMRGLYDACLLGMREEKIYRGGRRRRGGGGGYMVVEREEKGYT